MTPEVVQFVKECLDEDDVVGIKKQRHTARRIYHRLVDEYHFTGSESSVRNLVHDMRAARKISQVFIPLRFMPGDAAQIDWGEATVIMNGEIVSAATNVVSSGMNIGKTVAVPTGNMYNAMYVKGRAVLVPDMAAVSKAVHQYLYGVD